MNSAIFNWRVPCSRLREHAREKLVAAFSSLSKNKRTNSFSIEYNMTTEQPNQLIYKVVNREQWSMAEGQGVFTGAEIDVADGYIHFSTAEQVVETVTKHFAGQNDLLIVAVDAARLGEQLKWEPSRGGALFPHLYDTLDVAAAKFVKELPLDSSGVHVFPDLTV
jgi:uncharacterized protein (DUF952 family)